MARRRSRQGYKIIYAAWDDHNPKQQVWDDHSSSQSWPSSRTEQLGALVTEKNPKIIVAELQRFCMEMGKSSRQTTITVVLHKSGLHGRVARWKPLLSVRHMKARVEFAKKYMDSQTTITKNLWSDETKTELLGLSSMWGENQTLLITSPLQSQQ